ncbi:hypothetical protein CDAR_285891 [Caerostris darwini]|uniref:Uncharacterized protein n=1 Tax=Caerostris darwini TaxID=1538125 RepID=A0AAV4W019_9ARAC|nr:hypothetical protein CDAR_285891 [Caerostris darwini]
MHGSKLDSPCKNKYARNHLSEIKCQKPSLEIKRKKYHRRKSYRYDVDVLSPPFKQNDIFVSQNLYQRRTC